MAGAEGDHRYFSSLPQNEIRSPVKNVTSNHVVRQPAYGSLQSLMNPQTSHLNLQWRSTIWEPHGSQTHTSVSVVVVSGAISAHAFQLTRNIGIPWIGF